MSLAQPEEHVEHAEEAFDAGEVILEHIANSDIAHPLLQLPQVAGIDFSVTKQVFMLWLVAVFVFVVVTASVQRYLRQERRIPTGFMTGVEWMVQFIRDSTATANFNVTAALASITFASIIIAGARAHGFTQHWKNLVPRGLAWPIYILLIPIEILGMFVKPFALTMRLAANMTAGHIAILAVLSFVFIFNDLYQSAAAGIGVGLVLSVPLAVGISALEIIVVLIQAYVFTLLSAVFIGMAINVHH